MASASVALSITFGAEVLAAVGLLLAQVKILWVKVLGVSTNTLLVWLKAQGLNFARVELVKRWFLKSLLPLIIGAATQRRIAEFTRHYVAMIRAQVDRMMEWYRSLPRPTRIILVLIAMFSTLAVAVMTMSIWLLLFSIQLPIWILASLHAFWSMIWTTIQKTLFRTLAFMQLYRVWGVLRRQMPTAYLTRLRRFNFRVARIVVRRRRMTVSQLHNHKGGFALRWALFREYFRHARPAQPTAAEFELHRQRQAEDA